MYHLKHKIQPMFRNRINLNRIKVIIKQIMDYPVYQIVVKNYKEHKVKVYKVQPNKDKKYQGNCLANLKDNADLIMIFIFATIIHILQIIVPFKIFITIYLYNIIVMLSQFISSGKAYYNHYQKQLSLSYINDNLIIDKLQPKFQQITSLNLIHCHLQTLQGIQQFQNLQQLNIKCNNISQVDELFRIPNKQNINRLQFIGNDIQYLGAALFINLIESFPNLIELNGKNYHSILHKNSKKKYKMKNILAHVHKMQKQLQKTIRKQQKKSHMIKKNLYDQNYNQYLESDCLITQNREKRSKKLSSLERYQDQSQIGSSKDLSQTSKKKYIRNSQSHFNHQNHIENGIELHQINQFKQENDISLCDISNIPLTRSVRASTNNLTNSQIKQQKKKALQIVTLNESLGNKQNNLQPVTATFAMQRQKENICQGSNMMFKNMRRNDRQRQNNNQIQDYNYQSKIEIYKDKEYSEGSSYNNYSLCSQYLDEQNIMYEQIKNNETNRNKAAQAWFYKRLLCKIFEHWKILPHKGNVPMKRNQY